ncbi:hypothetical protein GCM10009818_37890 [Nakamurella flavida]
MEAVPGGQVTEQPRIPDVPADTAQPGVHPGIGGHVDGDDPVPGREERLLEQLPQEARPAGEQDATRPRPGRARERDGVPVLAGQMVFSSW